MADKSFKANEHTIFSLR